MKRENGKQTAIKPESARVLKVLFKEAHKPSVHLTVRLGWLRWPLGGIAELLPDLSAGLALSH